MQQARARIGFRIITSADDAFLFAVFAGTREWEFQHTVWDPAEKDRFLRQQFAAQDAHYQLMFPKAVRRIIQANEVDIGRLYLDRRDDSLLIMDFSLLPAWRGRGIGTDILRSLINEAHGGKVPVRLHVEENSPALALYLRHGFQQTGRKGRHLAMEWQPDLRPAEI